VGSLYGQRHSFTEEARQWLEEIDITVKQERELLRLLMKNGDETGAPPEPFAPLIGHWRAGAVPPLPPADRKQPWPEGEQVHFKV
jgi:hypothetical protein